MTWDPGDSPGGTVRGEWEVVGERGSQREGECSLVVFGEGVGVGLVGV